MSTEFWLSEHLDILTRLHLREKFPHALLVYGQEGVGKLKLLELLSERMLCTALTADLQACGECYACGLIKSQTHPDFKNLALGEKSIKIADIRALEGVVHQSSHQSNFRIILISSVERMTTAAANALLKMLEEPPEKTLFLLSSDKPHRLLPTIRSRCQQYLLAKPDYQEVKTWLQEEGYGHDKVELSLQCSEGAPLKALSLLNGAGLEDYEKINQALLGLASGRLGPLEAAKAVESMDQSMVLESLFSFSEQAIRQSMCSDGEDPTNAGDASGFLSKALNIGHIFGFCDVLMHKARASQSGIQLNQRLVLDELMVAFSSSLRA